jgi:hypothetical protein
MSYNKKIVAKPLKKYCKVCHDSGKPESEYTSHFIRESPDPKSAVICPTLLALECRFCFQSGHTIKYCKVLEARDKETELRFITLNLILNKRKNNKKNNSFAVLDSDKEEKQNKEKQNKEEKPKKREEFPALITIKQLTKPVIEPKTITYSSIVSSPPVFKPVAKPMPEPVAVVPRNIATRPRLSWAAMESDSEDEEFDEEFEEGNNAW